LAKDQELADKLKITIAKLEAITSGLEAGQGTAGRFLKDETLYNNLNQVLTQTQDFLKAFRENPKKYLSIKLHIF
jgi:phospholipid/cholesterol/gamma-HCH transport system substrate-binding protein